jgi:hypothetical protein
VKCFTKIEYKLQSTAYCVRAVSYACNMFMKTTTGVNVIHLFSSSLTQSQGFFMVI